MREYLPTVMDVSSHTLELWAGSTEPVNFYGAAKCFAFDVAATVLTGVRFDGDRLGVPPGKLSHPDPHAPMACHSGHILSTALAVEYHPCHASLCGTTACIALVADNEYVTISMLVQCGCERNSKPTLTGSLRYP